MNENYFLEALGEKEYKEDKKVGKSPKRDFPAKFLWKKLLSCIAHQSKLW